MMAGFPQGPEELASIAAHVSESGSAHLGAHPAPGAAAKFLDLAPMRARPGPHFDRSRRIVDGHLGDHLRMLVPTSQTLAS